MHLKERREEAAERRGGGEEGRCRCAASLQLRRRCVNVVSSNRECDGLAAAWARRGSVEVFGVGAAAAAAAAGGCPAAVEEGSG